MTTTRVEIEHDDDPDFSWLTQDMYDPSSPEFEHTYRDADMKEPFDPEYYRDPDNHVALCMIAYDDNAEGGAQVVDSLGNIDFLRDSDEWKTGTFYYVAQLEAQGCPYLAELAKEMGLP